MTRFASGLPISGQRVPVYDGDEDFIPDMRSMDLSEVEAEINRLHASIESEKNEKKAAADEKAAAKQKEIEAALAAYRQKPAAAGAAEKEPKNEAQNAPQAQST